jgi:hypothetical protein
MLSPINEDEIEYLKLQRTALNKSNNFGDDFYDGVVNQFDAIKLYLPESATNILDIGCGMGAINCLLNEHYDNKPNFHLLDKHGKSDDVVYGFDEGSIYCDLNLTSAFLNRNGIPIEHINIYDGNKNEFPNVELDLIISTIAWGFHFPITEYFDKIKAQAKDGCIIITDVRERTRGIEFLSKLGELTILKEYLKHQTVMVKVQK